MSSRLVVKLGTSTITDPGGRIDDARMADLVSQMARLAKSGSELVVVTSGAIAAGLEPLGFDKRPRSMPDLQAIASVGQGLLVNRYARLFGEHGIVVGQVLLTQHDITHRAQYLHARDALKALLKHGVVPVVNENDTTAVDEIRFGDNDTLAALVAILVKADLLILLTDIPGLLAADPKKGGSPELVKRVARITPDIERMAGGAGTHHGSGGMVTKVSAARIATSARVPMVIADGRRPDVILDAAKGKEVGTYFEPARKAIPARKLWIGFGRQVRGSIVVDDGARDAICSRGRSLLPAGVIEVRGRFAVGDAIDIRDRAGSLLGRGLSNFSARELDQVRGLRSERVAELLPDNQSAEVIHRDCLVIFDEKGTGSTGE